MRIKDIHALAQYEKKCAEEFLTAISKDIGKYVASISIPEKAEQEIGVEEIKILTFLYSIYYNDSLVNNKNFQTDEQIFFGIKTDITNHYTQKYQMNKVCENLAKLGLLEKRKEGKDDSYYISKYGILYVLSTQKEYEWSDSLLRNTIIGSLHVIIKNHIDGIIFSEIEKNNKGDK